MDGVHLKGVVKRVVYTKDDFAIIKTEDGDSIKGKFSQTVSIDDSIEGRFIKEDGPYGDAYKAQGTILVSMPKELLAICRRIKKICNFKPTSAIEAWIKSCGPEFWTNAHITPLPDKLTPVDRCRIKAIQDATKGLQTNTDRSVDLNDMIEFMRSIGLTWSVDTIERLTGYREDCEDPYRVPIKARDLRDDPLALLTVKGIRSAQIVQYLDALYTAGLIDEDTRKIGNYLKECFKAEDNSHSHCKVGDLGHLTEHAVFKRYLHKENECLYRKNTFTDEKVIASFIVEYATDESEPHPCFAREGPTFPSDMTVSPMQHNAAAMVFNHRCCIINGFAGTGKTTTLKYLAETIKRSVPGVQENILFLAPTGKAVEKLINTLNPGDSGQDNMMTIHRFAGTVEKYILQQDASYEHSENDIQIPECVSHPKVIVLEEAGMICQSTLAMFFRALEQLGLYPHLVFMGDTAQLSPVGIGNPFLDIIACKHFNRIALTEVYRQTGGSLLEAVTQIRKGHDITVCDDKFRITKYSRETRNDQIIAWSFTHPDGAILATKRDLVSELTPIIRDHLNPEIRSEDDVDRRAFPNFRPNDKIMQIRNNPGRGVYNGTSGTVVGVVIRCKVCKTLCPNTNHDCAAKSNAKTNSSEKVLHVRFNSSDQYYTNQQAYDELNLAFVITVHKAQGSEYDNVLMVMDKTYGGFINRNLVYTGTSRGKKTVQVLVESYDISAWKQQPNKRSTMLQVMINELLDDSA
jgi:hypothetical protein